jgi:hypothetical protein
LAKGCTSLDCCYSEDFRLELNITPIIANIDSYRKCWGKHLLRMDGSQIPKITFKYNLPVEVMWDIQGRGGHCEDRKGPRPEP